MDLKVFISTTTGSVNINDKVNYRIVEIDPGGRVADNTIERSPYTSGVVLSGARSDMTMITLKVRCYGNTSAEALNKFWALEQLVSSWDYQLTLQIDTWSKSFKCMPANITPMWSGEKALVKWYEAEIRIPRQPTLNPMPVSADTNTAGESIKE